jgi:hypothetical protein
VGVYRALARFNILCNFLGAQYLFRGSTVTAAFVSNC